MIVGGMFDGNLAVAALPPVIAAALAAACVIVMAGAASVGLSGRRARRRRVGRAVMVDFTGQRLTPYCWDAEADFIEDPTESAEAAKGGDGPGGWDEPNAREFAAKAATANQCGSEGAAVVSSVEARDQRSTAGATRALPPTPLSAEERLWSDIQAVGEPGGLQRVVDGLNEAS